MAEEHLTVAFETDEFHEYAHDGFDELLNDTPASDEIILCKGRFDGQNFEYETTIKGIIQNNVPNTQTKGSERQLLVNIGDIQDYKYVKYDNAIWIIMTNASNNKIYEKVVINQCNWILKWQNAQYEICQSPCYVTNASQYNSGEISNKTVSIGYNQFLVYVSTDNDTLSLSRDNRMFIDYDMQKPTPYKITRIDTVSYSFNMNLVTVLIFTESQLNDDTDNLELMICDYKTPIEDSNVVEITYYGEPEIRCGGVSKTFSVDTSKEVSWEIKCADFQKDDIIVTPEGTKCKLKVLSNTNLIGSSFKLIAKIGDTNNEILISVIGGM
jgi:hypothetical protein